MQDCRKPGDVARDKTSFQVTTHNIFGADYRNDGDIGSVACTQAGGNHPWWAVDLGFQVVISGVMVIGKLPEY